MFVHPRAREALKELFCPWLCTVGMPVAGARCGTTGLVAGLRANRRRTIPFTPRPNWGKRISGPRRYPLPLSAFRNCLQASGDLRPEPNLQTPNLLLSLAIIMPRLTRGINSYVLCPPNSRIVSPRIPQSRADLNRSQPIRIENIAERDAA